MSNLTDKCIALAALFMAGEQVNQIAYTGSSNSHNIAALVSSLFNNEVEDSEMIYGQLSNLKNGLAKSIEMLSSTPQERDALDIMRYVISLIDLEKQLSRNQPMGEKIIATLDSIKRECEQSDDLLEPAALEKVGDLYQNTISQLGPRILIKGEQKYLESPLVVAKIRATLLAGIRAAVLWRQSGGSRMNLLLSRKSLVNETQRLLSSI